MHKQSLRTVCDWRREGASGTGAACKVDASRLMRAVPLSRSGTMDSRRLDSICRTAGYVTRMSGGVGGWGREASSYPDRTATQEMARGIEMLYRRENRIGATCAIGGGVLLLVGTYLHPMETDPNDAVAAFTEYAADRLWVASHLTQLAGVALMVAALLLLTQQLEEGSGKAWARIAAGGASASLAVAAALQAVDGIALKVMVNAWAAVPAAQKEIAFHAAFAVRQIEIGLASMGSLLFGLTVTVYGVALLVDQTYPKWMGGLAIVGGIPTMVAGVVMAYTGFSGLAMAINMPASSILLVWMLTLGVLMWRRGGVTRGETAV